MSKTTDTTSAAVPYARSMMELAEPQGQVDAIGAELADLRQVLRDNPSFARFLADPGVKDSERNGAIDTIDTVERTDNGWHVAGRRQGGAPFDCSVGSDGQIQGLNNGRIGAVEDRQWDDDRYAAARQAQDAGAAPAYPGGPVDGDSDDGRYNMTETPGT